MRLEPNNTNTYKCTANACVSLERYDTTVKYYNHAVKYDPNDGNRYYDLGYALVASNKLADEYFTWDHLF